MNIPAQLIQFELTDLQPTFADYIQSQKDENTRKFNIQFLFERNILSLSGCTATATVTIDNVLIDQELACTVDDTNNYVTVVVDAPYSGVMAVQVTLASGNDILTMPRPLYIRVTQDIAETAQIGDNSHGSFAEIVTEVANARGEYATLAQAINAKMNVNDATVYHVDTTTQNLTYDNTNPKTIYLNATINDSSTFNGQKGIIITSADNSFQLFFGKNKLLLIRHKNGETSYTAWEDVYQPFEKSSNKKTAINSSDQSSTAFFPSIKAIVDYLTANYTDTTALNTLLNSKADVTYVDNGLNTKADSSALTAKADVTYVDNRLNTKADVTYVDNRAEEVGDLKSALNGTVDLIGDTTIYNVSLAESGTGVGANWNHYYDISLPKGTKLNFYLSAYTGVLFTDVLVRFYDTTNTLRSLAPSVMQTGKLQTYTLFEDCTRIWVQINRSAIENGVSAQFIMSFDTSGLSADVAKIQSVLPTNTQEVLKSNIQKYDGKRFKNNGVEEDTESGWITSDYLPVGLGITATGYSYSSTRPGIVEYNASKQTLGVVAGNGEYVTRTYTPPTKVAYVRLQTLASKQDTKATSIINSEPKVYRVEKNGSGDFTKLVDAINEAVRYMDSVVYVGAGTWDIIDELGSEYVESVSITQRGLYLKNRVRVICSSNSLITCNYTGSRADTISWLSAFNAGPLGFSLENATIESSNCRYAIHDERDQDADEYNNYYINCKIKHDNTDGGYNQCIGGGLGLNGRVIIDGCIFENPARTNYQIVYYHNSAGSGKSFVEVKGSYFKGTNTLGFQWYGSSPATQKSTLFAHGNSLGSAIQHTGASGATVENTEVISFNNEIRP